MKITRNPDLDILKNDLEKNGISSFFVGLPPKINDNSVAFVNPREFLGFIKKENIKSVFYTQYAITIDDYYITNEILCDTMGVHSLNYLPPFNRQGNPKIQF